MAAGPENGARRKRVVISGYGSLGQRLAQHLVHDSNHLVLLDDYAGFHGGRKLSPILEGRGEVKGSYEHVQADLAEWGDWTSAFDGADAVVHFAAVNPYPECTWEQSRLSMRMNANVVAAAQRACVRRLVLASSSHVHGGFLQDGAQLSALSTDDCTLGPSTPLRNFTHYRLPGFTTDASAYAAAKVMLEEAGRAAAARTRGLSVVAVRIGWCQPGENHPRQMSVTATPTISADTVTVQESARQEVAQGFDDRDLILAWLHRIWLSTRDFRQLFSRAIESNVQGYHVVNGVSRNADMRWSTDGWAALGYEPEDDALEALSNVVDAVDQGNPDAKRARG